MNSNSYLEDTDFQNCLKKLLNDSTRCYLKDIPQTQRDKEIKSQMMEKKYITERARMALTNI